MIACAVLETPQGLTLIDPGPSTTLKTLETTLSPIGGLSAVKNVVLTHIHLDHAGCVGQLAKLGGHIKFYVHPIGAPHLIDPERLTQSAKRIYGDKMDRLWGTILPVPHEQVYAVEDDHVIDTGGRFLRSCYTPGHASHHIAWVDDQESISYVGDASGMRVQGSNYIIPVAPPPDINVDLWEQSLQRLESQNMDQLFLVLSRIVWVELQTITEKEDDNSEMFRFIVSSSNSFDLCDFSVIFSAFHWTVDKSCILDSTHKHLLDVASYLFPHCNRPARS